MVADLERIRETLEKETGRVASLSSWADAAGVDKKVLQQRLHFGWYCRDELLRSTHSLIVYLARNYRGMGVAFEDLLQVHYMFLFIFLCFCLLLAGKKVPEGTLS